MVAAIDPVAVVSAEEHVGDMESVFALYQVRSDDEYGENAKLIGVYRTETEATAATVRLSAQSGFAEYQHGWQIDCYPLDKDHWAEGFLTDLPNDN